jgi:tetratricopeptide (TPR) repeat protein
LATFDRQKKEQEAQKALSKNNYEKAIEAYGALLRHDPRDRRMRQKLADLYQRVGRKDDAAKQYRELARMFGVDGNHRAAIAVYKKLVAIQPSDSALLGELAGCYNLAGFENDAVSHYEQAINGLESRDPKLAAEYCKALQALKPGDNPLRIRTAELLAISGGKEEAFEVYRTIITDLRRRGRMDEVGRLATQALKLKEDQPDLLQDAAEACLVVEDAAGALRHLQVAYQADPGDPRTLELLARSFEMGEDTAKARPILVALSKVLSASGSFGECVSVLERALAVGPADAEIQKSLERAKIEDGLASLRLTEMDCANPVDEVQLRLCVRMAVFQRYGFGERGLAEVLAMDSGTQETLSVRAQLAELRIALGQNKEGLALAEGLLVDAGGEIEKVQQRIAVLTGKDLSPYFANAKVEDISASDESPEEDLFGVGETVDVSGFLDDALESEEEVLDEPGEAISPPLSDDALFGEDGDDWVDDEESDDLEGMLAYEGTVAEVDPADFSGGDEAQPEADFEGAEGLIAMGLFDEAMAALGEIESLRVATLKAHCLREQGQVKKAYSLLRDAVDDAEPADPGQAGALFELAQLAGRVGKHRPALRYLRELQESFPAHRFEEVSGRVRALKKVLGE